jgi:hypothetical protein
MNVTLTRVEPPDPGWHRFVTSLDGQPFVVDVSARQVTSPADAHDRASAMFHRVVANEWELTAACAADLLDDYNDEWSNGHHLDRDEFRRRLQLSSCAILPNGMLRVEFRDGGLFRGHAVVLEATAEFEPVGSFIEG